MKAAAGSIGEPAVLSRGRRHDASSGGTGIEGAAQGSALVPAPRDGASVIPVRAGGIEFLGAVPGSGYRQAPSLVRRADGQTVQLTPILYRLLEAIDGRRDHAELAETLSAQVGRLATADDVRFLSEARLRPLGLLRRPDGAEPTVERANPLLGLRLKAVLANSDWTRRLTAPFAVFFHPTVVAAVVAAFVVMTWWILFDKGLASAARGALYDPELLLLVLGLTLLSAGFHELGHAAACRYGGARAGAMGFGLYLVWPAFYTDVTDSYRLGRGGRLRVDLGGLYFNAIFGLAVVGVWLALGSDALLLAVAAQLLQMSRQLIPFVRFDGYHILADLTGVPDLFRHIKPTLRGLLPARSGPRTGNPLRPWARVIVTLWVLIVVPVFATILTLLALAVPRILATAWDSVGIHWGELTVAWDATDTPAVVVGAFKILMIFLPIGGSIYVLARIVRRTVRSVWRATAGHPVRRGAAVLAGAALLAGVAWAWWPGDQYQPLGPEDQWTLAAPTAPVSQLSQPQPQTVLTTVSAPVLSAGRPALPVQPGPPSGGHWMILALPESMLPGEPAQPEIPAAVSTDAPDQAGGTASGSAWPFPFDPPDQPGPGDNQALAINTEDGSSVVDVAIALVWVSGDETVDNENAAYAYASCSNCQTLAIAFQVVLVIGYAQVVMPTNAAVAVNFDCDHCTTAALAMQLVATLAQEPSDEAMSQLNAIWTQLEQASQDFSLLPLADVYAILDQTRTSILDILAADGARATQSQTTTTADAGAGPDQTTAPEPTSSGADTTVTSEPAPDTGAASTEPTTTDETTKAATEPTTTTAEPATTTTTATETTTSSDATTTSTDDTTTTTTTTPEETTTTDETTTTAAEPTTTTTTTTTTTGP